MDTPYLLIDKARFLRNIDRLYARIQGVSSTCEVRPHLKTLRSVEAAAYLCPDKDTPTTVSTLAEAEGFAQAGYTDILYAVGIAPHKLARVARLMRKGVRMHVLLDTVDQARAVSAYGREHGLTFSVYIEIDCDGHRGGIEPTSAELLEVAQALETGATLTGLMTHAGESYSCNTEEGLVQAAEEECASVRAAAGRLTTPGLRLSVGATPTAHFARNLDGISEVRAGVFTTFDLVMKNVGVCAFDDIAMFVVTTVIGVNKKKRWVFVDAGWTAMSRDRGTAAQDVDYGYGLLCDMQGRPLEPNVVISATNQEHGMIELPPNVDLATFAVGMMFKVMPNHACATAAMHLEYQVEHEGRREVWHRITGW